MDTNSPLNGWQIIVVDNGFAFVGDITAGDHMLLVQHAKNLRRWGTTAGLGQLVSGPTKDTVADPVGEMIIPVGRVVFTIPLAKAHKWAK